MELIRWNKRKKRRYCGYNKTIQLQLSKRGKMSICKEKDKVIKKKYEYAHSIFE